MMNPHYLVRRLRETVAASYLPSRELSLAMTKLDEFELWMGKTQINPAAQTDFTDGP